MKTKNVDQNSIATMRTDGNGEAIFSNLNQQIYYYYIIYTTGGVFYNCTNDKTNGALVPNTVNTITETLCQ